MPINSREGSVSPSPPSIPPGAEKVDRVFLRRSLPGEYVGMLMVLTGASSSLYWLASDPGSLAGVWGIVAGAWIAARSAGWCAGAPWTALVTARLVESLVVLRCVLTEWPTPLLRGVFGAPTLLALLGIVFLFDTLEANPRARESA